MFLWEIKCFKLENEFYQVSQARPQRRLHVLRVHLGGPKLGGQEEVLPDKFQILYYNLRGSESFYLLICPLDSFRARLIPSPTSLSLP